MIKIAPIRAFKDNYIWLLINNKSKACAVVDPGDATPVLDYLQKNDLHVQEILITHHHHDHSGGITELLKAFPKVRIYGPMHESIAHLTDPVSEAKPIHLDSIDCNFQILDIPGHTKGHVAYLGNGMLFCGDTLFAAGCGRVFEGTHAQMFASLEKISRLPLHTAIYCGHEYTQANLTFAAVVEPANEDIKKRMAEVMQLRDQDQPTLPSTIEIEKKTNPFLRCDKPTVIAAAQQQSHQTKDDPVFVFQTIRTWKDTF